MSGLTDILARVNSRTDDFLRTRLGAEPVTGGFKQDGRFNLAGLIAVLSVGARDRARGVPEHVNLSALDSALVKAALDRVHSPVTIEEAKEILDLLKSGAVTTDVASALHVTVGFARRLPPDLFIDVLQLPQLPKDIADAIGDDLAGATQREPRDVLTELRDGRIDRAVLPKTLGLLLNRAATNNVTETIRTLIGPENRSVRLAILLYARTQGIDIEEDDLDALYQAINPVNPDLSPLLNRGLDRLAAQYHGAGEALAILRRLAA